MDRIAETFARLNREKRAAFVAYLCAGVGLVLGHGLHLGLHVGGDRERRREQRGSE